MIRFLFYVTGNERRTKMDRATLVNKLKEYMEEHNLSNTRMAKEIGVSKSTTLLNIFNDPKYVIQRPLGEKLARFLKCDIGEIDEKFKIENKPLVDSRLKLIKSEAIEAAKDFGYGEDVYKALKAAKTHGEINRIMTTARHAKFD